MTILFNGKKGVPQSYKDVAEKLRIAGQFNLPVQSGHSKRKRK